MPSRPGTELEIQVREPATSHRLTVGQIQRWCDGVAVSPDENAEETPIEAAVGLTVTPTGGTLASSACSAYNGCMQYTIRRIPPALDSALRQRARASGKSLNEAAVDTLAEGAGMAGKPRKRRDLRDIAGTWKPDKAVDMALAAQDQVDADLWR